MKKQFIKALPLVLIVCLFPLLAINLDEPITNSDNELLLYRYVFLIIFFIIIYLVLLYDDKKNNNLK